MHIRQYAHNSDLIYVHVCSKDVAAAPDDNSVDGKRSAELSEVNTVHSDGVDSSFGSTSKKVPQFREQTGRILLFWG